MIISVISLDRYGRLAKHHAITLPPATFIVPMPKILNPKNRDGIERFSRLGSARAAAAFDLVSLPPEFYRNPYPWYHALREHSPAKVLPDGSVFLSRYEDCRAVYSNSTLFSSDKKIEFAPKYGDSPLFEHHTSSLVFSDPPLHTRVRQVLVGALSPRAIASLEASLIVAIDHLLDKIEDHPAPDLIIDFASVIPIEVIGNLLGIPHDERGPLRDWSLAILGALEPVLSSAQMHAGNTAVVEFKSYLKDLVAQRRANPLDPDVDVLTRLIQSNQSDNYSAEHVALSENELMHNCIFLLNAGHETTTNLIGNGLEALLRFTNQRDLLILSPDLIKPAVEEFLRFESSNQLGNRRATAAFDIAGVSFVAGTRVHLGIGAANRDPAVFDRPDELNISRSPNRHLAFGFGAHACAGLNLARLEGRVAISAWLARFPNYSLGGQVLRTGRVRFRGFAQLPIKLS